MPLNLIDKAFFLKKTPLFQSLDLDLLLTIAEKTEIETYKRESPIFQQGSSATRLYLIMNGIVTLKSDWEQRITTYDCFGDEALFSDRLRAYDALATTDTELLTLSSTHFFAILNECPIVAITLLEFFAATAPCRKHLREK